MIDWKKNKFKTNNTTKLEHCLSNPEQTSKNTNKEIRLTKLVESAGCASKISQDNLRKILAALPKISDPRVLVSPDTWDDAGVYKLDDKIALVQTVDVFTPCADDPYTFGQIAAANSVSDIYAMGGKPMTALSIIGFPINTVSYKVMRQIIWGGIDKMKEAGVVIIGGHSINDKEIKFGFAVTGSINPAKIITNNNAQPGDILILTKPIGTGVINFANKMDKASVSAVMAVNKSMAELNKTASEIIAEMGVTTATDVTGFGLIGHLSEIVVQSGVTAEIYADQVPLFDGVVDYIRKEMISCALRRNKEYASQYLEVAKNISQEMENVFYDPQTSGGLLIAIGEEQGEGLLSRLKKKGIKDAAIIGKVISKSGGRILLKKIS